MTARDTLNTSFELLQKMSKALTLNEMSKAQGMLLDYMRQKAALKQMVDHSKEKRARDVMRDQSSFCQKLGVRSVY